MSRNTKLDEKARFPRVHFTATNNQNKKNWIPCVKLIERF